jgi:hypothetical protein
MGTSEDAAPALTSPPIINESEQMLDNQSLLKQQKLSLMDFLVQQKQPASGPGPKGAVLLWRGIR